MLSRWTAVCWAALIGGLVGCQKQDDIKTYTVPKTADSPRPGSAVAQPAVPDAAEYRIIGAMFPADAPQWFFRLVGPSDQLQPYVADYEKLLKTVRFPNGTKNPPVWDTPAGWKLGGPRPGRMGIAGPIETVVLGPADKPLEITITAAAGDPFMNVERWSVQLLGNKSFQPADMPNVTKTIEATGTKGLWADVRGPKNPAGGRPMMGPPR